MSSTATQTTRQSFQIAGCRHDVLGHNLKAIGLLHALSCCATAEHRDADAEGWWNLETGSFHLSSSRYPDNDSLVDFFTQHYTPTPIFSAWNTGGGLDKKREVVLSLDSRPFIDFIRSHESILRQHGYENTEPSTKENQISFELTGDDFYLETPDFVKVEISGSPRRVLIEWSEAALRRLPAYLLKNLEELESFATVSQSLKKKLSRGNCLCEKIVLPIKSLEDTELLKMPPGLRAEIRTKMSGEKATIAVLEAEMSLDEGLVKEIELGRVFFDAFQQASANNDKAEVMERYRDEISQAAVLALDAITTTRAGRRSDNPLFLRRGEAGNSEIFRSFWSFFLAFRSSPKSSASNALFPAADFAWEREKSPGTPFFPDAIKSYNNGNGWVTESFPFAALDYILAVEGAIVLRGAVARTLSAGSRRFAAFPFVFDSGEDLVNDNNETEGTASSIWLPLWTRPTCFRELQSFIGDAQARLPGKDARFSSEFARALHGQGVDAGFAAWQEFRFKMKASRVPWVCTGHYLSARGEDSPDRLSEALAPLDKSRFLDQFEPRFKGNKIETGSPHRIRTAINYAIEEAIISGTPRNCLKILISIFDACRQLCSSRSLRERIGEGAVIFFDFLPQEQWEKLLAGLEELPEFRVARALASIQCEAHPRETKSQQTQSFLGSLLPLIKGSFGWFLPSDSKNRSHQAVWTGTNLCFDLAQVLLRRYLDSTDSVIPALVSSRPAHLHDIVSFLNGELDEHLIARWTEALSLIGWTSRNEEEVLRALSKTDGNVEEDHSLSSLPFAYTALRSLLELECETQKDHYDQRKRRRSKRPIVLASQATQSSLALAVEDSLRWISLWGVPNRWGHSRELRPRLAGNSIVRIRHEDGLRQSSSAMVKRIPAALTIPLRHNDHGYLFRAVTLPMIGET